MKRILLLQTGGTIAMGIRKDKEREVSNKAFTHNLISMIPQLRELADITVKELFFKDSSDIDPNDWQLLATEIANEYANFDGFVVLHGTDTMAYSASALSYCFRNLNKPVIFTGSQVPLSVLRSDAGRNLINAVQMATIAFHEVGICFSDKIFRGNRCTKVSISDFNAYSSPNFPPLAEIGLNIDLRIMSSPSAGTFRSKAAFSDEILVIRVYPGINPTHLFPLLESGIKAVIISAFGSGNFPVTGNSSMIPFLEACFKKNIFVAIASQATHDSVDLNKYESGRLARDMGCMSAGDMTMEATITKMMYLLGNYTNPHQIRDKFMHSIAGELTV